MKKSVMIYVASHKDCEKYGDKCYHLLHVGAAKSTADFAEYRDDSEEDNISVKNPVYCELTGVYWMWKNAADCDYIGLCHYRRYLGKHKFALNTDKNILSSSDIIKLMEKYDVIVPTYVKRGKANGWFTEEATRKQYRPYLIIKKAVEQVCPHYLDALEKVFSSPKMFYGNILITRKEIFDEYSEWLFSIENKIESNLENSGEGVAPRELGYFSEWLLNVWLLYHSEYKVYHRPVFFTQKTNNLKYIIKCLVERIRLYRIIQR